MISRRAGSDVMKIFDDDRPEVRVVGIANTATMAQHSASLNATTVTPVTSIDDAMALLYSNEADAFALGNDALPPLAAQLPGSRVLEGGIREGSVAIPSQQDRRDGL